MHNTTKHIIGVVGFIGSGKDTVADYLQNFHGFRRESFASTLKDAVSNIFGWDRTLLEGRTAEAREWREQVDTWWATRLNIPHLTPRWALQYWGTEVGRNSFHTDIWIASLENKLRKSADNIVISDCRFPNEIQSIKNVGGTIVWVQRGPLPTWYNTAILANSGNVEAQQTLKKLNVHLSESSWINIDMNTVIENNSTIDDLYSKLSNLI